MTDKNWLSDALCAKSEIDFFSEDPVEQASAKSLCSQCPVRMQCLSTALENKDRFGIWGGASETDIRNALSIDPNGKPTSSSKPLKCPYCGSKNIKTLEKLRTKRHVSCAECSIVWWTRTPSKTTVIEDEDINDDLGEDI